MGRWLRHIWSICVLDDRSMVERCFGALAAPVRQCEISWTTWKVR